MAYPFSPRTWSVDEWHRWCEVVKGRGVKTLMVWPGLEFFDLHDPVEFGEAEQLCRSIFSACQGHDLELWLGRSMNAMVSDCSEPPSQRDVRHCTTLPLDSPSFGEKLLQPLGQLLSALPAFQGWWIIDRDPGCSHGSSPEAFGEAFQSIMKRLSPSTRPIYWMWGGWTETRGQAPGWRNEAQPFWTEALGAMKKRFGDDFTTLACWPGHLKSCAALNVTPLRFPYHALEAEPSIPFSHLGEAFEPSIEAPHDIFNLQTPCLRTCLLGGEAPDSGTSWQDISDTWVWDREALERTSKLWQTIREEMSTRSLSEETMDQWIRRTGAHFPWKRGPLLESLCENKAKSLKPLMEKLP